MNQNFEILAPAGSFEILKQVIRAGADAVYLGGGQFGARAYANNFNKEELLEALNYAHLRGKKIYLTVNTLLKNQEIEKLYDYLLPYYEHGLDAVLVQDFGALDFIHSHFPDLPIHTSTQMTITGVEGINILKQYGVSRVVMAREMSIAEMKRIHEETGIELEAFVHGALCYCYSGQCLFSSMLGGRSGNRGRCAQPCRLPYSVLDEHKKTILKESYILSLKDLCGIHNLKELEAAGVYSLKIEGRMKSAEYAAGVVSMYRKYVDSLALFDEYTVLKEDDFKLETIGNRCGFTNTYFHERNGENMVTFEKPSFCSNAEEVKTEEFYQKINGNIRFKVNEPAKLIVSFPEESITVSVDGPIVDQAKNKPITKEDLLSRIRKTKDTAFLFDNIDAEISENAFLPIGAINQLKREAILKLEDAILAKYRRISKENVKNIPIELKNNNKIEEHRYIISIENRSFLSIACNQDWATDIYLDYSMYQQKERLLEQLKDDCKYIHSYHKRVFYILPPIFRANTSKFYNDILVSLKQLNLDGFVVKNIEEIAFIKNNFENVEIIADHNLYTYNDYAVSTLKEIGIVRNTVPLELNRNEIKYRQNQNSQMIIYGYYPLMTTAPCVHKNTALCDQKPQISYLKDRYQAVFPVRNCCSECTNIIYNSLPTLLFRYYEEIIDMNVSDFRLHFSIENAEDMKQICKMFSNLNNKNTLDLYDGNGKYTNGHYKRGVE